MVVIEITTTHMTEIETEIETAITTVIVIVIVTAVIMTAVRPIATVNETMIRIALRLLGITFLLATYGDDMTITITTGMMDVDIMTAERLPHRPLPLVVIPPALVLDRGLALLVIDTVEVLPHRNTHAIRQVHQVEAMMIDTIPEIEIVIVTVATSVALHRHETVEDTTEIAHHPLVTHHLATTATPTYQGIDPILEIEITTEIVEPRLEMVGARLFKQCCHMIMRGCAAVPDYSSAGPDRYA